MNGTLNFDCYCHTHSLSIRNALIRNYPLNSSNIRNDNPLNSSVIRNEFSYLVKKLLALVLKQFFLQKYAYQKADKSINRLIKSGSKEK